MRMYTVAVRILEPRGAEPDDPGDTQEPHPLLLQIRVGRVEIVANKPHVDDAGDGQTTTRALRPGSPGIREARERDPTFRTRQSPPSKTDRVRAHPCRARYPFPTSDKEVTEPSCRARRDITPPLVLHRERRRRYEPRSRQSQVHHSVGNHRQKRTAGGTKRPSWKD